MSHIALYRKYRPNTFDDVVGQEHIVSHLKKALAEDKIGHAYLFSGSRGLGKTSIARILASELGIQERDVYEIDAASNRGIDDIRALREEISTLPFESPYKIYIIDEVHMLTKEAFNALLKTLEEPPSHAKFVLATTEIHKLPDTIVSRCEVHDFDKPTLDTLKKHVQDIAKKEGYELDEEASLLVSKRGNGSYRDTLSFLEKTIQSSEDTKVDSKHVSRMLGASEHSLVVQFVQALDANNTEDAFGCIKTISTKGLSFDNFIESVVSYIRDILTVRHVPSLKDEVLNALSEGDKKSLLEIATNSSSSINSRTLKLFLDTHAEMSHLSLPEIRVELAVLESTRKEKEGVV